MKSFVIWEIEGVSKIAHQQLTLLHELSAILLAETTLPGWQASPSQVISKESVPNNLHFAGTK